MVTRRDRYVLYPSYFDASLPRRLGRRAPRDLAVRNPTLRDLIEAAERLGLNPEVDENARHPRVWYNLSLRGRVFVEKRGSKQQLILEVARVLKQIKAERR